MAGVTRTRERHTSRHGRDGPAAYHHGALKETLLEIAESVLLEHGVDGFTLRECARRAGVSHGAPAHHFGDARGLLTEFTAVSFEQLEALMREYRAGAAPDGYSQVMATGLAYFDYALAHRARFQLMFRSDRLDHGNPRLAAAAGRTFDQLQETLELLAAPARARDGSLQAKIALAWSIVHGFAMLMLDNRQFVTIAGGEARRARDLLAGLLAQMRPVFEADGASHRKGAQVRAKEADLTATARTRIASRSPGRDSET